MLEIALRDVKFRYNSAKFVLDGVNLSVEEGEFVGILGPNGCGKTTLLKIISGLLPVYSGIVRINGLDPYKMKRKQLAKILGFVTQDFAPIYNYTVKQIVLTGRLPYVRDFFATWTNEDLECVRKSLERVDAVQLIDKPFHNLSSGEQKRVAIARILAQETDLLLLDEPTAYLDPGHVVKIRELLRTLHKDGKTLIATFHDINIAVELCDKLVLMKDGKILFCGSPDETINSDIFERVYDVHLSILTDEKTNRSVFLY